MEHVPPPSVVHPCVPTLTREPFTASRASVTVKRTRCRLPCFQRRGEACRVSPGRTWVCQSAPNTFATMSPRPLLPSIDSEFTSFTPSAWPAIRTAPIAIPLRPVRTAWIFWTPSVHAIHSRPDGPAESATRVAPRLCGTVAVWLVPTFHSLIEEQVG
jgi:hypothetical protein